MGLFDFLKKQKENQVKLPEVKVTLTTSFTESGKSEIQDKSREDLEQTVAFKKCMAKAIPSENGLYPHELLMLSYATSYSQCGNSFARFWYYECHYTGDPQQLLDSLAERGFIEPATLEDALNHQTAAELKELLKEFDLKVSGKKADLVHRLMGEGNTEVLEKRCKNRVFQRTEKGEAELKANEYIPYIHKRQTYGLSIWDMNRLMNTPPKGNYRDKIWAYFNQKAIKEYEAGNFGLYRNVRWNMCEFLMEEKKYDHVLPLLSEVIFFDLSGVSNGYSTEIEPYMMDSTLRINFPYEDSCATIPPAILRTVEVIQEALDLSREELKAQIQINKKSSN